MKKLGWAGQQITSAFCLFPSAFSANALILSGKQVIGEAVQDIRSPPEWLERCVRFLRQSPRHFPRALQSDNGWIGGFLGSQVLARTFSECFGSLRDIKDIVDDLERESEGFSEF